MREIVFFVASLAGAAILTALAVLNPEASLLWKNVLSGGITILAICALALFIDIIRCRWPKEHKMIPILGMIICGLGFIGCAAWYFWPSSASKTEVQRSEALNAVRESTETPTVQSMLAPAVEAPTLPHSPAPIAEVPTVPSSPTTAPPPTPPEKPRRNFVDADVTPESLAGLYEEHTRLGAAARASKYIGKWMPVSGPLHEVMGGWPILGDRTPAVAAFVSKGPSVLMVFSGEWIDRVAMLQKNQSIYVIGQIEVIERSKIVLENCELVDSDQTTNAQRQFP
jgi:hypothetical protein